MASVVFSGEQQFLGPAVVDDLFVETTFNQQGMAESPVLHAKVKQMSPGSLLLASSEFSQVDHIHLRGAFIEDPQMGYGREESAHLVTFGQVVLASASDYERPELVAMKPYSDDTKGVVHEFSLNRVVNTDGSDRAFRPLGIWRDEDGGVHLITRYEHAVTTLDGVLWADPDEYPDAMDPLRVAKSLRLGAYGVGLINGHGFSHGDAQPKNMGTDSSKVRFVDLEETRKLPLDAEDQDAAMDVVARAVLQDLRVFASESFRNPTNFEVIADVIDHDPHALGRSFQTGIARGAKQIQSVLPEVCMPTVDEVAEIFTVAANNSAEEINDHFVNYMG